MYRKRNVRWAIFQAMREDAWKAPKSLKNGNYTQHVTMLSQAIARGQGLEFQKVRETVQSLYQMVYA
jgi:hypothetical protein